MQRELELQEAIYFETHLYRQEIEKAVNIIKFCKDASPDIKERIGRAAAKFVATRGIGGQDRIVNSLVLNGGWKYEYIKEVVSEICEKGLLNGTWASVTQIDTLELFLCASGWPLEEIKKVKEVPWIQNWPSEPMGIGSAVQAMLVIQDPPKTVDPPVLANWLQQRSILDGLLRGGLCMLQNPRWDNHPDREEFLWIVVQQEHHSRMGNNWMLTAWVAAKPGPEAERVVAHIISGEKLSGTRRDIRDGHAIDLLSRFPYLLDSKVVKKALLLHPDKEFRILGSKGREKQIQKQ